MATAASKASPPEPTLREVLDAVIRLEAAFVRLHQEVRAIALEHGERLGDWKRGAPWLLGKQALAEAFHALPLADQQLLERTAERIRAFAEMQRRALSGGSMQISGGRAGHELLPVERAGCYAPGGRFPLPSSVLMTAVTARVAGVESVWVASPKPVAVTLAAAHVAGADGLLALGGQLCMTKAYASARTQRGTLVVANLQYSGIVFAAIYSVLLFGDQLPPVAWLGMVLIVGSGIVATILRARAAPGAPAEEH